MDDLLLERKLQEQLTITRSYLMKMGATKEDAEDVVQDTAYKFLLYMDSVDVENVEGWLFRVAVNQYYDLTRKQVRRKKHMLHFRLDDLIEEATPESMLIQLEEASEVKDVLQRVKKSYSELLILKYSTGLSIREISELYNMKEASVKTNLYRARKQFIKQYRRFTDER